MGRPRPPGSHCRFGRGIELVRYLDCRAIRLLCQGDHLPSARPALGPGSFRDDAMVPTIAHLFDEYHSLKSEVFPEMGSALRHPTTPNTSLRFPTFPFLRPKTCPKQRPTIPHDSLQVCYTRCCNPKLWRQPSAARQSLATDAVPGLYLCWASLTAPGACPIVRVEWPCVPCVGRTGPLSPTGGTEGHRSVVVDDLDPLFYFEDQEQQQHNKTRACVSSVPWTGRRRQGGMWNRCATSITA